MLDAICRRVYGVEKDWTETVLAANPGLAEHGPVLSSGLVLYLPEPPTEPAPQPRVRLWS